MQQRLFTPPPKTWDAVNHRPYDSEHQRALEGLPHYWRMGWGWEDVVILACGHARRALVEWLDDAEGKHDHIINKCPYSEFGACSG